MQEDAKLNLALTLICMQSEGRQHGKYPHAFRAPCLTLDPCSHHHTQTGWGVDFKLL